MPRTVDVVVVLADRGTFEADFTTLLVTGPDPGVIP